MKTMLRVTSFGLGAGLLVVEVVGLLFDAGTISESVWGLPWWARWLVGLFCAWLAVHFGFKVLPAPRIKPPK